MKNRCAWVEVLENRGCFRCRCVWRQVEVSLGCFSRRDQRSELVGIQSHRALLSALSTSVSVCTGTKQREQECERWPSSTSSSLFPVYCSLLRFPFYWSAKRRLQRSTTDFLYTQAVVPAWWKCMQLLRNTTDTTPGWKGPPNPSAFT